MQTNKQTDNSVFSRIERNDRDLSKPNVGIFSRAIRNTIALDTGLVVARRLTKLEDREDKEPAVLYEEEDDCDEDSSPPPASVTQLLAIVSNLPHGMTDTRLRSLAGEQVQVKPYRRHVFHSSDIFDNSRESFRFLYASPILLVIIASLDVVF